MGRIIIARSGFQSLTVPGTGGAAFDLLELKLASTQFAVLHSAIILQHSLQVVSKVEELRVAIKRGNVGYTSGSGTGGIAPTIVKNGSGDAVHGLSSALAFNTTQAAGSVDTLMPGVFNLAAGEWERTYTPELRPTFQPSEGIILSVDEALEETLTIAGVLIVELFG